MKYSTSASKALKETKVRGHAVGEIPKVFE
jgi:hypothetical protein